MSKKVSRKKQISQCEWREVVLEECVGSVHYMKMT